MPTSRPSAQQHEMPLSALSFAEQLSPFSISHAEYFVVAREHRMYVAMA